LKLLEVKQSINHEKTLPVQSQLASCLIYARALCTKTMNADGSNFVEENRNILYRQWWYAKI